MNAMHVYVRAFWFKNPNVKSIPLVQEVLDQHFQHPKTSTTIASTMAEAHAEARARLAGMGGGRQRAAVLLGENPEPGHSALVSRILHLVGWGTISISSSISP